MVGDVLVKNRQRAIGDRRAVPCSELSHDAIDRQKGVGGGEPIGHPLRHPGAEPDGPGKPGKEEEDRDAGGKGRGKSSRGKQDREASQCKCISTENDGESSHSEAVTSMEAIANASTIAGPSTTQAITIHRP